MEYRPSHTGIIKFGLEAGMLAENATAAGAAPALNLAGYGSIPNIQWRNNSQGIPAVGAYQEVDVVDGDKDISFSVSLKLGRLDFLKYLIRGSGVTPNYFGLPVLALGGFSDNTYGSQPLAWLVRYALCDSFTIRSQEGSGSPVTLDARFVALTLDEAAATQTTNITAMQAVAGRVLTWAHTDVVLGGISYRNFLGGVTVQVNNNVKPDGRRPDIDPTNILNRCPVVIQPHGETLVTTFNFKDRLPSNLKGELGALSFTASNANSGANPSKSFTLACASNYLNTHTLQQTDVGTPFGYEASTVSRFVSVTTTGT